MMKKLAILVLWAVIILISAEKGYVAETAKPASSEKKEAVIEKKADESDPTLTFMEEKQKERNSEESFLKIKNLTIKKEKYSEYTLGNSDLIEINVRRHTEFSGRFPIGPNGKIQYPFVGDIELAGLTKTEAIEKLKKTLSNYIENPEIDITIVEYNSKVVYVLGCVAQPGKYMMRSEFMPLREAVLAAGLPRENIAALRKTLIVRPVEGEKPIVKQVNLLSMLYDGNLELNYDLRSGDIVYLPSTVLYKVTTILDQVITPVFRGTSVYDTYDDIRYRRENRNNN